MAALHIDGINQTPRSVLAIARLTRRFSAEGRQDPDVGSEVGYRVLDE